VLTASERLRRAGVFQRAYSARKSISAEYFTLYVLPKQGKPRSEMKGGPGAATMALNNQLGKESTNGTRPEASQGGESRSPRWPLVGFVISKKVLKSACKRNRAKRRTREAYRHLRSGEKGEKSVSSGESTDVIRTLPQWYALVWVINEKVLKANWQEICKKMEECLLKASNKYGRMKSIEEERRPNS
jgi:ribonuclease P protein component